MEPGKPRASGGFCGNRERMPQPTGFLPQTMAPHGMIGGRLKRCQIEAFASQGWQP
jgi:hypothetical protein